jgi:hypothetical protein
VVAAGKGAVWQVGQVELRDSGPDSVRGNSDDELFAVQGVFPDAAERSRSGPEQAELMRPAPEG